MRRLQISLEPEQRCEQIEDREKEHWFETVAYRLQPKERKDMKKVYVLMSSYSDRNGLHDFIDRIFTNKDAAIAKAKSEMAEWRSAERTYDFFAYSVQEWRVMDDLNDTANPDWIRAGRRCRPHIEVFRITIEE